MTHALSAFRLIMVPVRISAGGSVDKLRRIVPWLAFWKRSARAAYRLWGSWLRGLFWLGTGGALLSLTLIVWRPLEPDRPLTVPLLIGGILVLASLCHGAYLTWSKEVDQPRRERDHARAAVAARDEELERVHANARDWQLLARLIPLIHDRRTPDALERARSAGPSTDPSSQFRLMSSLSRALDPWSTDVRMVLLDTGHQDMADRFEAIGASPPTSLQHAEEAYAARLELLRTWVNGDDELFVPPRRLDFIRKPTGW